MKTLIVFDSYFGNTEKIAGAINKGIGGDVKLLRIGSAKAEQVKGIDLLVVGSPTRAFRPTKPVVDFINSIPNNGLKGIKIAAFDTGISKEDTPVKILKTMIGWFGYAAKPIADKLVKKGGKLISEPKGFFVTDTEGPLKEGELKRAEEWGRELSNNGTNK